MQSVSNSSESVDRAGELHNSVADDDSDSPSASPVIAKSMAQDQRHHQANRESEVKAHGNSRSVLASEMRLPRGAAELDSDFEHVGEEMLNHHDNVKDHQER